MKWQRTDSTSRVKRTESSQQPSLAHAPLSILKDGKGCNIDYTGQNSSSGLLNQTGTIALYTEDAEVTIHAVMLQLQ